MSDDLRIKHEEMVASVLGGVKPLCADHQPVTRIVHGEGGFSVESDCPNCNWHAVIHPRGYLDFADADDPLRAEILQLLGMPADYVSPNYWEEGWEKR